VRGVRSRLLNTEAVRNGARAFACFVEIERPAFGGLPATGELLDHPLRLRGLFVSQSVRLNAASIG
jgi:hypothetical protein